MSKPDAEHRTLFSGDQVRARIQELAVEISRKKRDRPPCLCIIAEGARRFGRELSSALRERGLESDAIEIRARRTRGQVLLPVELEGPPPADFEGREVLILDDIADEGRTLKAVISYIESGKPSRVETAVLIDKRERRVEAIRLDYVGFEVTGGWVIGFGMDLDGRYRDLDAISVLSSEH